MKVKRPMPELKAGPRKLDLLREEARELGFHEFGKWFERHGATLAMEEFEEIFSKKINKAKLKSKDELFHLLRSCLLSRQFHRSRLARFQTVDDAVELFRTSRKIMVLTGAGISVSCGIPDFRSAGGLYSQAAELDIGDPQKVYPKNQKPSYAHHFIAELERRNKLVRNYTQNIDGLETIAGIKKVVFCHGSFAASSCALCKAKFKGDLKPFILEKKVKRCTSCKKGPVKPDIVFFGEDLPLEVDDCFAKDVEEVDLLLVVGSSLKVAPIGTIK
ncbi:NAD-dependent histone deacetylase sir2, partial [Phlyctochytrium bullatum]